MKNEKDMLKIKKIVNLFSKSIYYAFFVVVAIIALFLVLTKFPDVGGFRSMIVLSGSMEPAIHTGSVVVVKRSSGYKIDDVITFGYQNTSITHRILDVKKNEEGQIVSFVTKGDANEEIDSRPVSPNRILGKVLFSIPWAGYGVETVRRPIGFFLVIILPALIIIFDEIRKIYLEIKKRKSTSFKASEEKKED